MKNLAKMNLIIAVPAIIKGSAYILMGVGGVANAIGYPEIGGVFLGTAALFGLKDTISTLSNHQQENLCNFYQY